MYTWSSVGKLFHSWHTLNSRSNHLHQVMKSQHALSEKWMLISLADQKRSKHWKAWFVASRPSLKGFQRVSEVFQSHVLKPTKQNYKEKAMEQTTFGISEEANNPEWFCFFSARRRSCKVTHNNTGQRANLWLWTPVVCIWGLSRAWERGSLQGPKAPTHSQMSSTEEGWRIGAKEGRRRQNMFYSGGELGSGTLERPGLDTVTLSTTTYIPQQFLSEKMCDNAATLLASICNVPFPQPSPRFRQSITFSIQKANMFFRDYVIGFHWGQICSWPFYGSTYVVDCQSHDEQAVLH